MKCQRSLVRQATARWLLLMAVTISTHSQVFGALRLGLKDNPFEEPMVSSTQNSLGGASGPPANWASQLGQAESAPLSLSGRFATHHHLSPFPQSEPARWSDVTNPVAVIAEDQAHEALTPASLIGKELWDALNDPGNSPAPRFRIPETRAGWSDTSNPKKQLRDGEDHIPTGILGDYTLKDPDTPPWGTTSKSASARWYERVHRRKRRPDKEESGYGTRTSSGNLAPFFPSSELALETIQPGVTPQAGGLALAPSDRHPVIPSKLIADAGVTGLRPLADFGEAQPDHRVQSGKPAWVPKPTHPSSSAVHLQAIKFQTSRSEQAGGSFWRKVANNPAHTFFQDHSTFSLFPVPLNTEVHSTWNADSTASSSGSKEPGKSIPTVDLLKSATATRIPESLPETNLPDVQSKSASQSSFEISLPTGSKRRARPFKPNTQAYNTKFGPKDTPMQKAQLRQRLVEQKANILLGNQKQKMKKDQQRAEQESKPTSLQPTTSQSVPPSDNLPKLVNSKLPVLGSSKKKISGKSLKGTHNRVEELSVSSTDSESDSLKNNPTNLNRPEKLVSQSKSDRSPVLKQTQASSAFPTLFDDSRNIDVNAFENTHPRSSKENSLSAATFESSTPAQADKLTFLAQKELDGLGDYESTRKPSTSGTKISQMAHTLKGETHFQPSSSNSVHGEERMAPIFNPNLAEGDYRTAIGKINTGGSSHSTNFVGSRLQIGSKGGSTPRPDPSGHEPSSNEVLGNNEGFLASQVRSLSEWASTVPRKVWSYLPEATGKKVGHTPNVGYNAKPNPPITRYPVSFISPYSYEKIFVPRTLVQLSHQPAVTYRTVAISYYPFMGRDVKPYSVALSFDALRETEHKQEKTKELSGVTLELSDFPGDVNELQLISRVLEAKGPEQDNIIRTARHALDQSVTELDKQHVLIDVVKQLVRKMNPSEAKRYLYALQTNLKQAKILRDWKALEDKLTIIKNDQKEVTNGALMNAAYLYQAYHPWPTYDADRVEYFHMLSWHRTALTKSVKPMKKLLGPTEFQKRQALMLWRACRKLPWKWWEESWLEDSAKQGADLAKLIMIGDHLQFGSKRIVDTNWGGRTDFVNTWITLVRHCFIPDANFYWNESPERHLLNPTAGLKKYYHERLRKIARKLDRMVKAGAIDVEEVWKQSGLNSKPPVDTWWSLGDALLWTECGLDTEAMGKIGKDLGLKTLADFTENHGAYFQAIQVGNRAIRSVDDGESLARAKEWFIVESREVRKDNQSLLRRGWEAILDYKETISSLYKCYQAGKALWNEAPWISPGQYTPKKAKVEKFASRTESYQYYMLKLLGFT